MNCPVRLALHPVDEHNAEQTRLEQKMNQLFDERIHAASSMAAQRYDDQIEVGFSLNAALAFC